MENVIKLRQSMLQDIAPLLDDAEAIKALRKAIRQIKAEKMQQTYPLSANDKENIASAIASAHDPVNYPHSEVMEEMERLINQW